MRIQLPLPPEQPAIIVDQPVAAMDTPVHIWLTGFHPGALITVRARMVDPAGGPWAAEATYRANPKGKVDLSTDAPVSGGLGYADSMGLFWSMRRTGPNDRSQRDSRPLPSTTITLTAKTDNVAMATATLLRVRAPTNVRRAYVRTDGLVGTLCYPVGTTTGPGVLLLGGSEGGRHEADAALLAAHGYTVLALAYFQARYLPDALVRIPVEYFQTGLNFLRRRVGEQRLGVIGGSRGGEAALLLASLTPEVRAVASVVGSAVLTQAIGAQPTLLERLEQPEPAWTYRGRSLPFLPCLVPPRLRKAVTTSKPVDLALAYQAALDEYPAAVAEATIPVERIAGRVLLLSAGDDRIWPCSRLSAPAVDRFRAAGRADDCQHVEFPEAGHLVAAPPFGPATRRSTGGPGVRLATGGTLIADAAARVAVWQHLITFLDDQLRSPAG